MAGIRSVRPIVFRYLTVLAIFTGLVLIVGCDDIDVLDETGLRFRVSAPVTYDDNGVTDGSADMYPTTCTTGTEDLTSTFVTVQYESASDMLTDGYITRIDVNVQPNDTTFFDTDFIITNIQNNRIAAEGGKLNLQIQLITAADKEDYRTDYAAPTTNVYRFTLTTFVTYTPQDPDEDYEVPPVSFIVTTKETDNCE